MSLGKQPYKTYLNLKRGKIYHNETAYDYVEGYLKAIEAKERIFRDEIMKYWYIDIQAPGGDLYSLSMPYESGAAKSLFNSLATAENFNELIKIQAYNQDEYTKIIVHSGGERLQWKAPLPPLEEITVGSQTIKDSSKRMEFIVNLVNEINTKI